MRSSGANDRLGDKRARPVRDDIAEDEELSLYKQDRAVLVRENNVTLYQLDLAAIPTSPAVPPLVGHGGHAGGRGVGAVHRPSDVPAAVATDHVRYADTRKDGICRGGRSGRPGLRGWTVCKQFWTTRCRPGIHIQE